MKKSPRYDYLTKDILSEQLDQYDFQLLMFQLFVQKYNSYVKREVLSHYKIVVLTKGTCKVVCNNEVYHLTKPGTIFFVSPFTIFDAYCTSEEPVEFYHIHFTATQKQAKNKDGSQRKSIALQSSPTKASDHFIHMIKSPIFISTPDNAEFLLNYLAYTYREIKDEIPGCYYICKSFLMHLITLIINLMNQEHCELYAQSSATANKQELVLSCLSYIEDHMGRNVTVADLCELTNVSQSYLYQCFMSTFQCSTKEYITKYKLRKIEKFLCQSDDTIEQIALMFGFPTVYAFSSIFKKHYGMSPSEYRKVNQS